MRSSFSYRYLFIVWVSILLLCSPAYGEIDSFEKRFDKAPATDPELTSTGNISFSENTGLIVTDRRGSYPTNMVGHWSFENPNANVDASNNHPDGSIPVVNAAWSDDCFIGGCFEWFGGTTYSSGASIPYSEELNFDSGEMTIAFWMNPSDINGEHGNEVIIDNYTTGPGGFKIAEKWGGYVVTFQKEDGVEKHFSMGVGDSSVIGGKWSHVAISYSKSDNRFQTYFNGKLVFTSGEYPGINFRQGTDSSTRSIRVGQRAVGTFAGFHGKLDELHLFTRALSKREILDLYYVGEVYSDDVIHNKPISDILGSANGDGIELHISTDQGLNWIEASETDGQRILGGRLPTNSFQYRVSFLNLRSIARSVNLSLDTEVITACNDGLDNDGDGRIDLVDPGCESGSDNDESAGSCETSFKIYDRIGEGEIDSSQIPFNRDGRRSYGCSDATNPLEADPVAIGRYVEGLPEDFDGIVDWDCEKFGPTWRVGMFNNPNNIAKNEVRAIVANDTGLTGDALEAEAERVFDEAMRNFYTTIVTEAKRLRPNIKVGFYNLGPFRRFYSHENGQMDQNLVDFNLNELAYLWDILDVLMPSVYMIYPSRDICDPDYDSNTSLTHNISYLASHTALARQIADMQIANGRDVKVLPYIWYRYHDATTSLARHEFLCEVDLINTFLVPYENGADGVYVFGWEVPLPADEIEDAQDFFDNTLAPITQSFKNSLCVGAPLGNTITFSLEDLPGVSLGNLRVELYDENGTLVRFGILSEDGTIQFSNLEAGSYSLRLIYSGGENPLNLELSGLESDLFNIHEGYIEFPALEVGDNKNEDFSVTLRAPVEEEPAPTPQPGNGGSEVIIQAPLDFDGDGETDFMLVEEQQGERRNLEKRYTRYFSGGERTSNGEVLSKNMTLFAGNFDEDLFADVGLAELSRRWMRVELLSGEYDEILSREEVQVPGRGLLFLPGCDLDGDNVDDLTFIQRKSVIYFSSLENNERKSYRLKLPGKRRLGELYCQKGDGNKSDIIALKSGTNRRGRSTYEAQVFGDDFKPSERIKLRNKMVAIPTGDSQIFYRATKRRTIFYQQNENNKSKWVKKFTLPYGIVGGYAGVHIDEEGKAQTIYIVQSQSGAINKITLSGELIEELLPSSNKNRTLYIPHKRITLE